MNFSIQSDLFFCLNCFRGSLCSAYSAYVRIVNIRNINIYNENDGAAHLLTYLDTYTLNYSL